MNSHVRVPAPLRGEPTGRDLTRRKRRLPGWLSWNGILFTCLLLIPVAVVTVYSALIASDRYVSEARFMVRGATSVNLSGLAMMFRAFGIGSVKDDAFAVLDYMQSRDAVSDLSKRLPLAEILNRPEADFWSGYGHFWEKPTLEALYRQYQRYVQISYDTQSGIITLQVQAFRPQDSHAVAEALLQLGEGVVNRMNDRAHADSVAHAEAVLREAESRVIAAQAALSAFRNRELLFDPNSSFGSALQLIGTLTAELSDVQVQIQETRERAPNSPALNTLETRASALQRQIDERRAEVVGNDKSIASKMAEYERLVLNRNFADEALQSATGQIEQARQDARRQHIYIETIARSSLPDESTEPRRWRIILTTVLFGMLLYSAAWLLLVGAREHADVEV